jgi:hypothetical protein
MRNSRMKKNSLQFGTVCPPLLKDFNQLTKNYANIKTEYIKNTEETKEILLGSWYLHQE